MLTFSSIWPFLLKQKLKFHVSYFSELFPSARAFLSSQTGLRDFLLATHFHARDRETGARPRTVFRSYLPNWHPRCLKETLPSSLITQLQIKEQSLEQGRRMQTALPYHCCTSSPRAPGQQAPSLSNTCKISEIFANFTSCLLLVLGRFFFQTRCNKELPGNSPTIIKAFHLVSMHKHIKCNGIHKNYKTIHKCKQTQDILSIRKPRNKQVTQCIL